ncbi:hypothetical protein AAFC00_005725 [Neodothiora populina]|uniref:Uncharacterized protein n=1 Tax=Neodothiora populina TaxID=2781224 RepID=A0ABR3P5W8_9PEZI
MLLTIVLTLCCILIVNQLSKMLTTQLAHSATVPSDSFKSTRVKNGMSMPSIPYKPGQSLTFFDLPAEIRLEIYSQAVPKAHPYIIGRDYGHETAQIRFPAILQTSRQLRAEAAPVFYGANTFIVDIHELRDLKAFLKWLRVLDDDITRCIQDLRMTVAGALLVDVVWKAGRRRHDRVVATRPRLDNSLKWDRKNILHYVQDFEVAKPRIESLLSGVKLGSGGADSLKVEHLVNMVQVIFRVERLDEVGRRIFNSLKVKHQR